VTDDDLKWLSGPAKCEYFLFFVSCISLQCFHPPLEQSLNPFPSVTTTQRFRHHNPTANWLLYTWLYSRHPLRALHIHLRQRVVLDRESHWPSSLQWNRCPPRSTRPTRRCQRRRAQRHQFRLGRPLVFRGEPNSRPTLRWFPCRTDTKRTSGCRWHPACE
jgi:hypothetical protein